MLSALWRAPKPGTKPLPPPAPKCEPKPSRGKGKALKALPAALEILRKRAPRQFEVLCFVCEFKQQYRGNSPTYTNIADHFRMSISNAYAKVRLLERRGLIELDPNRNIMVVGDHYSPPPGLPL